MGTLLEDSFINAEQLVVGSYLDVGLLVFDGASLHLVSGFCSDSDGRIIYTRKVTFLLQPTLPANVEIKSILTNQIGSRVALVDLKTAFVIEIPNELWGRLSICSATIGEHVLPSYYCRCACIGSSVQPSSRSFTIIKAQWYMKEHAETGSKVNKIAVLYSDNVIRIFDTAAAVEVPVLKIDFRSVISNITYDASFQNSFGLHNTLVSFDFGPCVEIEFEDVPFNTIFAVDSENNCVYTVAFRFDTFKSFNVLGPFQLLPAEVEPSSFEVCDFFYIRHRSSRQLSVFALVSSAGVLSHVVAVPSDEVFVEGQLCYDFFVYDRLQLAVTQETSLNYTLANDPSDSGRYLLLSDCNAFSVDATPWINMLLKSFDAGLRPVPEVPKETHVDHIFSIVTGKSDLNRTKEITFTSFGATMLRCDDRQTAEDSGDFPNFGKRVLLATVTDDRNILTKVVLYESMNRIAPLPMKLDASVNPCPSLLERLEDLFRRRVSVPKLKLGATMKEKEAIEAAMKTVDGLIKNISITKSAYDLAQLSISNALGEHEKMGKQELSHNERLLEIVGELTNLKNRIYQIREANGKLKLKTDQICSAFAARLFPLSEAELSMRKTLEDLNNSTRDYLRQIPLLANQVAVERRRRFGATKSFHSSVNAKKFMISKSTDEIEEMMNWVKQLGKRIDRINEKRDDGHPELDGSRSATPSGSSKSLKNSQPLRTSTPKFK